jgi:hypothetical protein
MGIQKGIIYYTDSELEDAIAIPVRERIAEAGLPIVSTSLKPLDFGENYVFDGERGFVTMTAQILLALQKLDTKYVFFCEHDVIYNKSHFDFTPPSDDVFWYNKNVWRWKLGHQTAIRHERMIPLSSMCCNRELALKFYRYRWQKIQEAGLDSFQDSQSSLMRKWGFEPGTKKKRRGGLTDDDFDTWSSEKPLIDIRHGHTFSPSKYKIESFKHKPNNWEEIPITKLDVWN